MGLGRRFWTLWQLRPWAIASLLLAILASVWSVAQISLFPPGLHSRSLEMATATTNVVVDTPTSSALDLRQSSYDFDAMTQRAVLLGNVIANGQVRESIARAANVPVEAIQVTPPFTRKQPRAVVGQGTSKHASDIAKSTNQYRLSIQANPTVPLLDIYAQAPSREAAEILANSAVDSLKKYLADLAATQQVPAKDQIRLLQLGRARGTVINNGIDWQVALLAFFLTFALSSATVILVSRVIRGFRVEAVANRRAPA